MVCFFIDNRFYLFHYEHLNFLDRFQLLCDNSRELLQVILDPIKRFLEKNIIKELKINLIKINIIYDGK